MSRGNRSDQWRITKVYKENKRRTVEAYCGYTTSVNGMDIRGILEHSSNIPNGIISVFTAVATEPKGLWNSDWSVVGRDGTGEQR